MFARHRESFVILYFLWLFKIMSCTKSPNELSLSRLEGKIVGGNPIKIESFPFAALFYNDASICSGVVVSSLSILTAGHCFQVNKNKEKMEIAVGSRYLQDYDAEILDVLHFVIHEDYSKIMPFSADIALIFVKEPIKFDARKQRAVLADNENWMKSIGDDNVTVAGWGWTKTDRYVEFNILQYEGSVSELGLLQTSLRYVPRHECERLHSMRLAEDMFCLYGDAARDTCKGDSGGGVVWNGSVIGIVSHGNGCAKKDKPSVYISVLYHREWIVTQVGNFTKKYCHLKSLQHLSYF